MDIKDTFDEICADFSSRPLFKELDQDFQKLTRRLKYSLHIDENNLSCINNKFTQNSNNNFRNSNNFFLENQGELPPPIVRPAAVEALMHYSSNTSLYEASSELISKNNRINLDDFTSVNSISYNMWESQGKEIMRKSQGSSYVTGKFYLNENGGVQTPQHFARDNYNTSSYSVERNNNNNNNNNETLEEIVEEKYKEPSHNIIYPLKELDKSNILQHVRHVGRIYTHREEEENNNNNKINSVELRNNEDIPVFSISPIKSLVPTSNIGTNVNFIDDKHNVNSSPEVRAHTLNIARSSVLKELDELEKNHHEAVAKILKRTTPSQFYQHHNSQKLDSNIINRKKENEGLLQPYSSPVNNGGYNKQRKKPINLRQWDAANAPKFENIPSSILASSRINNQQIYDAKSKWSNVSFV